MRIEFLEKIADISEADRELMDRLGLEVKDKRYKYRRVCVWVCDISAFYEVNDKETILEFADLTQIVVKGSYDGVKKIITEAESKDS